MTDDTRIDLSALDPAADPARLERSVGVIAARLAPSLRRRREPAPALWLQLAGWRRPVLAAAALVVVASVVALVSPRPTAISAADGGGRTLAEAAGVPAAVASWVEGGAPLSDEAVLDILGTP